MPIHTCFYVSGETRDTESYVFLRAGEAPGGPRRLQDAPGGPRRTPGWPQDVPGGRFIRVFTCRGGFGKPIHTCFYVPESPQEAPGGRFIRVFTCRRGQGPGVPAGRQHGSWVVN